MSFTIALPAGRMALEALAFLTRSGIAEFDENRPERALSFMDRQGFFRIVLARSQDVPVYVIRGGADAGVTGRDVLSEHGIELPTPLALGFGLCRLSVAAHDPDCLKKKHVRVATKYPSLAQDFFFRNGLSCEIIKLHGSIEIAPALGMADCIVDLVSSGQTLRDNHLVEVATILESQAMFFVGRSTYALKTEALSRILMQMQSALSLKG
ncbi:MAG: ATP phosphoribosyltransferase [Spirochaetales bacterium]|nr:ATP phosphoribosyltransferase [Spirochaetales bacterium]